jgi:hypothetical protein
MKNIHFYLIIFLSFMINISMNATADEIRSNVSDVTTSNSAAKSMLNIKNNSDYLTITLTSIDDPLHTTCMYQYPKNETIPPLQTGSYVLEDDNAFFSSCFDGEKLVTFNLNVNSKLNGDLIFEQMPCIDLPPVGNCYPPFELSHWAIRFKASNKSIVDDVLCGGKECLDKWVGSNYYNSDVSALSQYQSDALTIIEPINESTHEIDAGSSYTFTPSGKSHPGSTVNYLICDESDAECENKHTATANQDGNWTGDAISISNPGKYSITATQLREGFSVAGPQGRAQSIFYIHQNELINSYINNPSANSFVNSISPSGYITPREPVAMSCRFKNNLGMDIESKPVQVKEDGTFNCGGPWMSVGVTKVWAEKSPGDSSDTEVIPHPVYAYVGNEVKVSTPAYVYISDPIIGTMEYGAEVEYTSDFCGNGKASTSGNVWEITPAHDTGRCTFSLTQTVTAQGRKWISEPIKTLMFFFPRPVITSPLSGSSVTTQFTVQGDWSTIGGYPPKVQLTPATGFPQTYNTDFGNGTDTWISDPITLACNTAFSLQLLDEYSQTINNLVNDLSVDCYKITSPGSHQSIRSPFTVQGYGKLPDGSTPRIATIVNGTQSGNTHDTKLTGDAGDVWVTDPIAIECGTQFAVKMINSQGYNVGAPVTALTIACETPTAIITAPTQGQLTPANSYRIEGRGALSSGGLPSIVFNSSGYEDDGDVFLTEWVDPSKQTWRSTVILETNCSTDFKLTIYDDDADKKKLVSNQYSTDYCTVPTIKLSANKIGPDGKKKRHHRRHFPFSIFGAGLSLLEDGTIGAPGLVIDSLSRPGSSFHHKKKTHLNDPDDKDNNNWSSDDINQDDMDCGETQISFDNNGQLSFSKVPQSRKTTGATEDSANRTITSNDNEDGVTMINDQCTTPSITHPNNDYTELKASEYIQGTGRANTSFTLKDNYGENKSKQVFVGDDGKWEVISGVDPFFAKGPHHIEMTDAEGATTNPERYYWVESPVTFTTPEQNKEFIKIQKDASAIPLNGKAFHNIGNDLILTGQESENGNKFPTDGLLDVSFNAGANGVWKAQIPIEKGSSETIGGWYLTARIEPDENHKNVVSGWQTNNTIDFGVQYDFSYQPSSTDAIKPGPLLLRGLSMPNSEIILNTSFEDESLMTKADVKGAWKFENNLNVSDNDGKIVSNPMFDLQQGSYYFQFQEKYHNLGNSQTYDVINYDVNSN